MRWIGTHRRKQKSLRVTLYSKPGCHLCEDALELLRRHSTDFKLIVEEIDIRSDPALFRQFDVRIPVMLFEDGSTLEAPIKAPELHRAIRRNVGRH